jgi:hypothetical protein
MVAHTYNSSNSGGTYRRIRSQGQTEQKVSKTPGKILVRPNLRNKSWMVAHACKPSYLGGRGRRIKGQVQPTDNYCKTADTN